MSKTTLPPMSMSRPSSLKSDAELEASEFQSRPERFSTGLSVRLTESELDKIRAIAKRKTQSIQGVLRSILMPEVERLYDATTGACSTCGSPMAHWRPVDKSD